MSSRLAVQHHAAPDPNRAPSAVTIPPVAPVEAPPIVPVDAAANDDHATSDFSLFGDPLWGMAIASGILFAILVALMAVG